MQRRALALAAILVAMTLAGCFGTDDGSDGDAEPGYHERRLVHTARIDPELADQRLDPLPPRGDGTPRPVSVARDTGAHPDDGATHFLTRQLIFAGTMDESDAFDAAMGTQTIHTGPPSPPTLQTPLDRVFVKTWQPADDVPGPDEVARLLKQASPRQPVELAVSDAAGLETIHRLLEGRLGGFDVGLNDVLDGHGQIAAPEQTFLDGVSAEWPSGTAPANAFDWLNHASFGTSPPPIGVPRAWWALESKEHLNEHVVIAFIDGGFEVHPDMAVPLVRSSLHGDGLDHDEVLGTPNFGQCGGNPCPWHGLAVAAAGAALADNHIGAAGPAGPIAIPAFIFTDYSRASAMESLVYAYNLGADIASMSFGSTGSFGAWSSIAAFDSYTKAFRDQGMLIFASAGNSNSDVDAVTCVPVGDGGWNCYESGWTLPCENRGVICVGGNLEGSRSKHGSSSFALPIAAKLPPNAEPGLVIRDPGTVDVFAPYTVWVPQMPNQADQSGYPNGIRKGSGTSVAAPFAAGVAALIWAADRGQSADEVEALLIDTLLPSTDFRVVGIVNAGGAVASILCDVPFDVAMTSPDHPSTFENGTAVHFAITGTAEEPVRVEWRKGFLNIGSGELVSTEPGFMLDDLDVGFHPFNVVVRDACMERYGTTVHVYIDPAEPDIMAPTTTTTSSSGPGDITSNSPPSVDITSHDDGDALFAGQPTTLEADATDAEDGALSGDALQWTATYGAGDPQAIGAGSALRYEPDGCGALVIEVKATDSQGASATDSVSLTVVCPQ